MLRWLCKWFFFYLDSDKFKLDLVNSIRTYKSTTTIPKCVVSCSTNDNSLLSNGVVTAANVECVTE